MPLNEVMEKTSSRQFLLWNVYLDEQWNEKTKLDGYLASLLQAIDSLEVTLIKINAGKRKTKRRVKKLDKYFVRWDVDTPAKKKKKKELSPEERIKRMKFFFGLAVGCPPTEEVFNLRLVGGDDGYGQEGSAARSTGSPDCPGHSEVPKGTAEARRYYNEVRPAS